MTSLPQATRNCGIEEDKANNAGKKDEAKQYHIVDPNPSLCVYK